MRVVVVSEDPEARQELVRALAWGELVTVGVDERRAQVEIRCDPADILIVVVPSTGGIELLRALCAHDPKSATYVIAVLPERTPARMTSAAIAAGAHDVLCAPYSPEELRVRVDVQRRLRRWMTTQPEPAARPAGTRSTLTELRAWQYLADVVIDDLEALFARPVSITEGWVETISALRVATIAMTLPSEQLELCISVVANVPTRRWLGNALLGNADATEPAIDDVMRELANMIGGALKRAALAEGPVLSTGIPVDGRGLPRRELGARCWTIQLAGDAQVTLVGHARRRANRRIPASRLAEGMIVVDDVRNPAGVLLLPSGTRLTATTAQRLSNLLNVAMIEVSA